MGTRGPKPKKAEVLALSGSRHGEKRARRIGSGVVREMPPAPPWLSEEAAEHWDRLGALCVELGAISRFDGDALAALCESLADFIRLRDAIREEGDMIESPHGRKANPLIPVKSRSWQEVVRLLGQLGLTPPGREGREPLPTEILDGTEKDGGVKLSV